MKRTKIKDITPSLFGKSVKICGWVRTVRDQKNFAFIEVNDGSTLAGLQIVAENSLPDYQEMMKNLTTGASVAVVGTLVESPGAKQKWEVKASSLEILGTLLCRRLSPPEKKTLL